MLRLVGFTFLITITLFMLANSSHAVEEIGDGDIPEGFVFREEVIGDNTVQYLERPMTAEELSKVEPAAGLSKEPAKGPLVGPKRQQFKPEVWATSNTE